MQFHLFYTCLAKTRQLLCGSNHFATWARPRPRRLMAEHLSLSRSTNIRLYSTWPVLSIEAVFLPIELNHVSVAVVDTSTVTRYAGLCIIPGLQTRLTTQPTTAGWDRRTILKEDTSCLHKASWATHSINIRGVNLPFRLNPRHLDLI